MRADVRLAPSCRSTCDAYFARLASGSIANARNAALERSQCLKHCPSVLGAGCSDAARSACAPRERVLRIMLLISLLEPSKMPEDAAPCRLAKGIGTRLREQFLVRQVSTRAENADPNGHALHLFPLKPFSWLGSEVNFQDPAWHPEIAHRLVRLRR
jgi:hypothetical protein